MTLQSLGHAVADDELGRQIAGLAPWFHNLHLPSGHETAADHPLGDFPALKWRQLAPHVPADLTGKRVLDVGCNAGFYSFALAALGAQVLAIDSDPHYLAQACWAAAHLDPEQRVSFRQIQVYDLAQIEERFDLVLFLGVLYHVRYPLLALDLLAERTAGTLILQTMTMPGGSPDEPPADLSIDERSSLRDGSWPMVAFIERRLAGDPTNWWVADDAAVRAMARSAGLRITATPAHETYICEPDPRPNETTHVRQAELAAATRRPALDIPGYRERRRSTAARGSFEIARGIVPQHLIQDALRVLHVDLITRGAPVDELARWLWATHWFPHLRSDPAILALAEVLPSAWRTGTRCDTQILLQFPHTGPLPPITFHLDREPPWTAGRRYARIVGVPLSPWRRENGGLLVECDGEPRPLELDPGDTVCLSPDLQHSGGINLSGAIRYGVYFRWLLPA